MEFGLFRCPERRFVLYLNDISAKFIVYNQPLFEDNKNLPYAFYLYLHSFELCAFSIPFIPRDLYLIHSSFSLYINHWFLADNKTFMVKNGWPHK